MSIEALSTSVKFVCFYTKDGAAVPALTVTADVYNPAGTKIVTAAAATEIGGGLYSYTLAGGSTGSEGEYIAIFHTAGDVDQPDLPSLWSIGRGGVEHLDADVSSRTTGSLANLDAAVSTRATPAQVTAAVAAVSGGAGSVQHTEQVTDDDDNPLDGVFMAVRTDDNAALAPVATGTTDAFGNVTFNLDPGTYYGSPQRAGMNFPLFYEFEVEA